MMEDMYELIKDVPQRVSYEKREPLLKTGSKKKAVVFRFCREIAWIARLGVKSSGKKAIP